MLRGTAALPELPRAPAAGLNRQLRARICARCSKCARSFPTPLLAGIRGSLVSHFLNSERPVPVLSSAKQKQRRLADDPGFTVGPEGMLKAT